MIRSRVFSTSSVPFRPVLNRKLLLATNNEHYDCELYAAEKLSSSLNRKISAFEIAGGGDVAAALWASPFVERLTIGDINPMQLLLAQIKLATATSGLSTEEALQFLGMKECSAKTRLEIFQDEISPRLIVNGATESILEHLQEELKHGIITSGGLETMNQTMRDRIPLDDPGKLITSSSKEHDDLIQRLFVDEPLLDSKDAIRDMSLKEILPPPAYEVVSSRMGHFVGLHLRGTAALLKKQRETGGHPDFILASMFRGYYDKNSMPKWLQKEGRIVMKDKGLDGVQIVQGDVHDLDETQLSGRFDLLGLSNIYDFDQKTPTEKVQHIAESLLSEDGGGLLVVRRAFGGLDALGDEISNVMSVSPWNEEIVGLEKSPLFFQSEHTILTLVKDKT